jgi:hypothetical protein
MRQQRVLFSGQPAREVGNACIASPLLISPLTGMSAYITPYVSLQDTSPIERTTYICGTTNMLFETKPGSCICRFISCVLAQRDESWLTRTLDWYDVLGSLTSGNVISKASQKDSSDRQFIKNVVSNLDNGEQWYDLGRGCLSGGAMLTAGGRVRAQFLNYTFQFLKALEENRLSGLQKKLLSDFRYSFCLAFLLISLSLSLCSLLTAASFSRLYKLYSKTKAQLQSAPTAPGTSKDPLVCLQELRVQLSLFPSLSLSLASLCLRSIRMYLSLSLCCCGLFSDRSSSNPHTTLPIISLVPVCHD